MLRPRWPLLKQLAGCGCTLALAACAVLAPTYVRPTLSVVAVQMQSGTLLRQTFGVKLNVQNPNARDLPVTSLRVALRVLGEEVATGQSDASFIVPANGATDFDMTVTANMAPALLKLAGRKDFRAQALDYELSGVATVELPFLHELPFHQNGTLMLH